MAIFAMSDLHLPLGNNKPMDVFGGGWENYVERIAENWKKTVGEKDTVLIGGDISWATYLDEALPDFQFLESLPGTKIIGKGNHDFWWSTATKLHVFFEQHQIQSVKLLYNNAYVVEDMIVCGTR